MRRSFRVGKSGLPRNLRTAVGPPDGRTTQGLAISRMVMDNGVIGRLALPLDCNPGSARIVGSEPGLADSGHPDPAVFRNGRTDGGLGVTMSTRKDFEAMTTNEKLFATGKQDAFDRAVIERDAAKVRAILRQVHVDEASIELTISGFGFSQQSSGCD